MSLSPLCIFLNVHYEATCENERIEIGTCEITREWCLFGSYKVCVLLKLLNTSEAVPSLTTAPIRSISILEHVGSSPMPLRFVISHNHWFLRAFFPFLFWKKEGGGCPVTVWHYFERLPEQVAPALTDMGDTWGNEVISWNYRGFW